MEVDRSRFASQIADYVDEADVVDSKPKGRFVWPLRNEGKSFACIVLWRNGREKK